MDQDARLAAHAAEVAVGVADRDSGDDPLVRRDIVAAIADRVAAVEGFDHRHDRTDGKDRLEGEGAAFLGVDRHPVEDDACPDIVVMAVPLVFDTGGILEVVAGKPDPFGLQRLHRPVEPHPLEGGVILARLGDVVGGGEVAENPLHPQARQRHRLADFRAGVKVLPDDKPDPAHAGVELQMGANGDAVPGGLAAQGFGVREGMDRLDDVIFCEVARPPPGGRPQHQDLPRHPVAAEGKGFLEVRNGKETDAEAFQLGGDVLVAVAIGVRLDDGDDAGARREGGTDCRDIRFQSVEIDLGPGAF